MKFLICWLFGHKWERFGYPSKDADVEKDDTQLFCCRRCWAMPLVKHNGILPRFVLPIHLAKQKEAEDA